MPILTYPTFSPLDLSMRSELHPGLASLDDGISEYCFAGLYLFRKTYNYQVAWLPGSQKKLVLRGEKQGKSFYAFPCGLPDDDLQRGQLLADVDYIKGLSERFADKVRVWTEQNQWVVWEDRDNFDYLYLREDLATLDGRKYHKKRNHVNAFLNNYQYEERRFCSESIKDAYYVLDAWHEERGRDDDYYASKEALDLCAELELCGYMVWVDGKPAAFTMGESLQKGRTFVVHIEKAISSYKGVYQFINMAFAAILPKHYLYINREQDLGNPGLRQSKMTYLPCSFIKKYQIHPIGVQFISSPLVAEPAMA
jgi:hypothetical protein